MKWISRLLVISKKRSEKEIDEELIQHANNIIEKKKTFEVSVHTMHRK